MPSTVPEILPLFWIVQDPLLAYTAVPLLFATVTPDLMTIGLTSVGELSVIPTVVLLLMVVMSRPSPSYAQPGNE
jgi:hypothetical protein